MRRIWLAVLALLFLAGLVVGCGPSNADKEALVLLQKAYGERYEFEFALDQYIYVTAREGVTSTETEAREVYSRFWTLGGKFPDGRHTNYIFMHFYRPDGSFLFQVGPRAILYEEIYY